MASSSVVDSMSCAFTSSCFSKVSLCNTVTYLHACICEDAGKQLHTQILSQFWWCRKTAVHKKISPMSECYRKTTAHTKSLPLLRDPGNSCTHEISPTSGGVQENSLMHKIPPSCGWHKKTAHIIIPSSGWCRKRAAHTKSFLVLDDSGKKLYTQNINQF